MKNKGLKGAIFIIVLVLVGVFMYQLGQKKQFDANENEAGETEKVVGILQFVSHPALDLIREGIESGLSDRGYDPEKNLTIAFQNGQADQSKLATMSEQLVSKKSDVIVGIATPAAQALANTTTDIPIVLGAVTDPVGAGLVTDMNHPGGNITGVSDKAPVAEQIRLGKELIPKAKRIGALYSSTEDNSKYQVLEARKAAEELGMTLKEYAVPSTNELTKTIQVMAKDVDFIYIPLDNTIANAMPSVVDEANKQNLPIITSVDTMVEQGALATIGIDQFTIGVEIGKMVADILDKKTTPASTPIYTFETGEMIINKKQAEFLGVEIPKEIAEKAKIVGGE